MVRMGGLEQTLGEYLRQSVAECVILLCFFRRAEDLGDSNIHAMYSGGFWWRLFPSESWGVFRLPLPVLLLIVHMSSCGRDITRERVGDCWFITNSSLDVGLCVVCYGNVRERPCESMFSTAGLVYRRSHVCRFACNVRRMRRNYFL